MKDRTLRAVVVGCGTIAERVHLPALAELETEGSVQVVGLVDPSNSRLAACRAIAPQAAMFRDLTDALAALSPEYVVVSSPAMFHREQTLQALKTGANVFCEKPFATNSADCDEMIAAAQRNDRVLAVGLMRRFYPSIEAIRSIIQGGVLGAPTSFSLLEGHQFDWPVKSPHPFQRANGGGVLADAGPHIFDILLWWFGELRVLDYTDDAVGGVEANCQIRLETNEGIPGTINLTRDTPLPNRYVVHCERGWVAFQYDIPNQLIWGWQGAPAECRVTLHEGDCGGQLWSSPQAGLKLPGLIQPYFVAQHRNVLDTIRGHGRLRVSPSEAVRGIALIEECYRGRRLMDMPWLEPEELRTARNLAYEELH